MKNIEVISNFKNKKLVEYLKDGMRVMILFNWHGMGDCIMFLPLYYKLKKMYPNVSFNLKCNVGQEIFDDINDKEYDIYFDIIFPEFNDKRYYPYTIGISKPHICCYAELGIPFSKDIEFTWKPKKIIDSGIVVPNNSVGVAFQVTSNPKKSIDRDTAKFVWDTIKNMGFNPIEVHFEHSLKNENNKKYDFIDNTCRGYKANIENVIDVINKCRGFIGVNTGTFCMATAMKNGNVLHMYKVHHFYPHYKQFNPVKEIDCRRSYLISMNIFKGYLEKIR